MPDTDLAARLAALPPLRAEIAAAGLWARKSLGQHFLLDPNLLARIAQLVGAGPGDCIYEVGAGPGGLTRALLATGARVVAVERDARAIPILRRLASAADGRLQLIEGDALAVDEAALVGGRAHIAANLPYNIGTALLTRWLTAAVWPAWWQSATLMFQKEVAERLVAAPGSRAYGRLSILAQLRAEVRIVLRLPARAFVPPPRVDSAIVRLTPHAQPADCPLPELQRLTAAAFGGRRKMLRQALKSLPGGMTALAAAGIDPTARAETLSVTDFCRLARALAAAPADS